MVSGPVQKMYPMLCTMFVQVSVCVCVFAVKCLDQGPVDVCEGFRAFVQ